MKKIKILALKKEAAYMKVKTTTGSFLDDAPKI